MSVKNIIYYFITLTLYENGLVYSYDELIFNGRMKRLIRLKRIVFGVGDRVKVWKFFMCLLGVI